MGKPHVRIYTGEGAGKTLAAFGLALRAIGHGQKVVIVQFLKGRKDVGEYKVKERLSPNLEIYQFGREGFVSIRNPERVDHELARKGIEFAKQVLQLKPDVLILDEVNLAASLGLIEVKDVLELIEKAPDDMVIVLTGRYAPKEFIDVADLVTEMKKIKHPFDRGESAKKGREY
ncbi:MAG: cob(I)yrinic acid a,c-diamide adenosyltransferase [Candidatus Methanomethylicota archaeon]|uniref:Cob(I)yrinic acid a,c-diamide adenosyltransferase n=1 Tax=Thermoproteota archaeon TaxID=2056631 RepID=A0A497ESN1_9CREN|nr:MAG: cob(I)yrinic acid a,c-diamide adenosyltransferase [Candidatus Verstraetearchaeota archaeon]